VLDLTPEGPTTEEELLVLHSGHPVPAVEQVGQRRAVLVAAGGEGAAMG
jgi:hypothetical protein